MVRRHRSSVVCGRMGDHRPSACDHHTDRRKWRQAFVRRVRCRSRFRSSRWIAGKARSRETTCTLFDSGIAIADRHHRSRRRWEPKDLANGVIAATAELASVERCSAPATRPPKPPPRHHAACLRGAMFKRGGRRSPDSTSSSTADRVPREHRPTRTSRAVAGSFTRADVLVANTAPR